MAGPGAGWGQPGGVAPQGPPQDPALMVPPEERKRRLAQTLQGSIARGGRIESQSDYQAVVVFGKRVNHILHLILTIITALIWGIVWIYLIATGGEKREMVTVDEWGNVAVQRL